MVLELQFQLTLRLLYRARMCAGALQWVTLGLAGSELSVVFVSPVRLG